ncbi:hypothetical protein NDU88_002153 [Pleurodeles waltl]|uniref:Uncharacterized protein n=1 Tax=Pleurodeles waltl TaxID=8319 RepID=A0AAV7VYV5_PLEWA|nr:hypothetical protein NDU88_002153 [Pleurodeles waltl]
MPAKAQGCRAAVRSDHRAGPANVRLSPTQPQNTAGGSSSSVDSAGINVWARPLCHEQARAHPLAVRSGPPRSPLQPRTGEEREHHCQRELAPPTEHRCSRSDRSNAGFMPYARQSLT